MLGSLSDKVADTCEDRVKSLGNLASRRGKGSG
jgi:hypothetical protein